MKKARFKMLFVAVLAVFALLFAGAENLQAQSDMDDPFALPTGTFVSAAEAEVLLGSQVLNLKGLIVTLTPGTSAYRTTERALIYYSTIQGEVSSGKDIPNSILTSLTYMRDTETGATAFTPVGGPNQSELWGLRNAAIDLLSQ
jgi:hypothetical protein